MAKKSRELQELTGILDGCKDYYQTSDSNIKDKAHTEIFKSATVELEEDFNKK